MNSDEIRYQVLRAIIQAHSQRPNDLIPDTQIMEITGLDRQTVQDEMDLLEAKGCIQAANSGDEHQAWPTHQSRHLFNDLAARRAQLPRAREVQQQILEFLLRWEQTASELQKNIIVGGVKDTTIAKQLGLEIQIVRDNLDLLQQRGCVMLRIYVAGPYRRIANLIALGRTIAREPDYMSHRPLNQITNISTGGGDYVNTGGGDYAGENLDKRQGTTFVDGDAISGNVIAVSSDVPTERTSRRDG